MVRYVNEIMVRGYLDYIKGMLESYKKDFGYMNTENYAVGYFKGQIVAYQSAVDAARKWLVDNLEELVIKEDD
jgi:hypothetical protein